MNINLDREQLTRSNQLYSPLLRLPAELRDRIYILVCADVEVRIRSDKARRRLGTQTTFGLIHACHQIRHEAWNTFQASCTFDISAAMHSDRIHPFLATVMCANVRAAKIDHGTSMALYYSVRYETVFKGLGVAIKKCCPRLERLGVEYQYYAKGSLLGSWTPKTYEVVSAVRSAYPMQDLLVEFCV